MLRSTRRGATDILLSREAIASRVTELGLEISRDYMGKDPVLIGILKGSVVFLADLVRAMTIQVEVDFLSISSYAGAITSSGTVRLLKDLDIDVSGRHVLVVEDIVDSGLSLEYIRRNLSARNPQSLSIAALLDKRERRTHGVFIDYIGFRVPDRFVIGYGLDYRERYRGLPYIAVFDETESAVEDHKGPAAAPPGTQP